MKVGLVLEGGAMRGMYTAGILDIMLDSKIKIDGIIGTSAGALFGVNYFSKQRGRTIRYSKRFCKDIRYMSLLSFIMTGNIINKNFAFYKVPFKLDIFDEEEFKKNNTGYYVTITNVKTGNAEYIKLKDIKKQMEVLRASSAIPLVSRMVKLGDNLYLDGGVSDSIPVEKMLEFGYDKIIVILTQPLKYRKKQISLKKQRLVNFRYKKYPNLVKKMLNRHIEYNNTIEKIINLEKEGKVFVIRPSEKLNIKVVERDKNKLQQIYNIGLKDGKREIKHLKKFLNSKE